MSSITCPVCGATSYNLNDVRGGYCARCHDWTSQPGGRPVAYVLDEGNNPVPAAMLTAAEWAYGDGRENRRVAWTEFHVPGQESPVQVSTVFLGIDHGFGMTERPVLFETMVFGGRLDERQWRYCTWAEAEAGHKAVVAELMARYVVGAVEGTDGL